MNRQTTLWILGIIFIVLLTATFMVGVAPAAASAMEVRAHIGLTVLP